MTSPRASLMMTPTTCPSPTFQWRQQAIFKHQEISKTLILLVWVITSKLRYVAFFLIGYYFNQISLLDILEGLYWIVFKILTFNCLLSELNCVRLIIKNNESMGSKVKIWQSDWLAINNLNFDWLFSRMTLAILRSVTSLIKTNQREHRTIEATIIFCEWIELQVRQPF